MHDHQAYGSLPKEHWIHKALAKTKRGKAAKSGTPFAKKDMQGKPC